MAGLRRIEGLEVVEGKLQMLYFPPTMDLLFLTSFHWPHYGKQPMRSARQVASIGTRKQNAGCNIERYGTCCNPRVSFPGGLSP
jgi:hypothetical protein